MKQWVRRGLWWGGLLSLVVAVAWAQTTRPPSAAKSKLERLIAVTPGVGHQLDLAQTRSGMLDKRPALEYLVGIDRYTGAYIPELAEKWVMSPDGKDWTVTLRQGIPFHDNWGVQRQRCASCGFSHLAARGSRERYQHLAVGDGDRQGRYCRGGRQESRTGWRIRNNYEVVFHLQQAVPEFLYMISANADLVMESKARWDAGGKELYGQKVVGTGPFEFVERKVGSHVLYKRVEKHWRQTPEYKELEFRWVPEGVTRLATLMAGEVHIADIDRALQRDAVSKGMQVVESKLPAMQHQWHFGGTYFATPDKLDPKIPFVKREVRQAMNKAVNRQAIADNLLGGRKDSHIGLWASTHSSTAPFGLVSGIHGGNSASRTPMGTTRPRRRRS